MASCCYRRRQQQQSSSHIMHQVPGIAYQVLLSSVFDALHPSNAAAGTRRTSVPRRYFKVTVYRSSARIWRVEISYFCCIVAQRPGGGDLGCGSTWCRCKERVQTSMVVWLTGIQYLHVLEVQRNLTIVRPSQASHAAMCEYRVMFAIFSTVVANET